MQAALRLTSIQISSQRYLFHNLGLLRSNGQSLGHEIGLPCSDNDDELRQGLRSSLEILARADLSRVKSFRHFPCILIAHNFHIAVKFVIKISTDMKYN